MRVHASVTGLVTLLSALALQACGGDPAPAGSGSAGPAASESDAPAASSSGGPRAGRGGPEPLEARTEPYDSSEFGALAGTVLFQGQAPERFLLGAASLPECKHHPEVDQRSNVVVVEDGRVANAFVHVKSGYESGAIPPVPEASVVLDQRGCMYVPRVVGVRVGQTLEVHNSDPTTHNVNLAARRNSSSNRSMGAGQPAMTLRFERRELPVPVKCDIHPWMGAGIFVEEHPWFAVSDATGAFRIERIPPGEYVLAADHEVLRGAEGKVRVEAGKTTVVALTLKP